MDDECGQPNSMESHSRLESCLQGAQRATLTQPELQLRIDSGSQELATRTSGAEAVTTTEENFWCYSFKVVPCPLRESHDWAQCPYVHPGEKMRRRDPRQYDYTGIACSQMRQEGRCNFGDACPFAHNDPEYWLHPTRFHTAICKQGAACQRRFCFFVHHPSELRTDAPRPTISPRARALQLAAASGQLLLPFGQAGAGSERGSSGSPAPQRHSLEMNWLVRSGSSTGSNSGRQDRVGCLAAGLVQTPLPKLEVALGQGQSSLELRAGVILRLAAAAAATGGHGSGGNGGSSLPLPDALGGPPFPQAIAAARVDQQGSMAASVPGAPAVVPSAAAASLSTAYTSPLPPSLGQLQLPLGSAFAAPEQSPAAAAGEAQGSWALVQTITNEVALGRLDMNQAAAILRHVLPPNELLRIELQVEGALAQHQGPGAGSY